MAFAGTNIYIGGAFQAVGRTTAHSLVRFDGQRIEALPEEPRLDPRMINIVAMEMFQGRLYVGGYFTNVAGLPAGGLACWDGTNWSVPGGDLGVVFALHADTNGLLVGGNFSLPGWTNPITLARWTGAEWNVLNYEPPDCPVAANCSRVVWQTASMGGDIYAAMGDLGAASYGLFRSDGTNGWIEVPLPYGEFTGLAAFRGKLVGSGFAGFNVAAFDGNSWEPLGGGFPHHVESLTANDHFVCIAFRANDGLRPAKYAVSRCDGTNWTQLGTNLFAGDMIWPVVLGPDDTVYACGPYSTIGNEVVPGLARWNGQRWDGFLSGNYNGLVGYGSAAYAFALHQGAVYVGGIFTGTGALRNDGVALWDGNGWQSVGGGGQGVYPSQVRALISSGPLLYAGGVFTNMGGVAATNIASWDGTQWRALGSGLADSVYGLAWCQDSLFACSSYTTGGEMPATNVVRWTGEVWEPLGDGCGFTVLELAAWQNKLYAGGYSIREDGAEVAGLASWDGATWQTIGAGFQATEVSEIHSMASGPDGLYVGGSFVTSGSPEVTNLARWDGTNWHAVGAVPPGEIYALAVRGSTLFAGASILTEAFQYFGTVYRWDGTNWTSLGSGVFRSGFPAAPRAILPCAQEVFVGGMFTRAGEKPSVGVARWIEAPRLLLDIQRPASGPSLRLRATSDPGLRFDLEASSGLSGWEKVGAGEDGRAEWSLDASTNGPNRFFRAIAKP